ncbi:MAG TPA: hypothetical protein VMC41_03615 [Candidatus Nanoarchaeia archaeon]|nr:hypothetical protein [Candidatus Nanoarchaeia archaeon]
MNNLIVNIIGGVIVAVLVSWLGIGRGRSSDVPGTSRGRSSTIVIQSPKARKTGKWIIIISVILIIWGIMLFGNSASQGAAINLSKPNAIYGLGLLEIGGVLFIIGKIIAWFQRP